MMYSQSWLACIYGRECITPSLQAALTIPAVSVDTPWVFQVFLPHGNSFLSETRENADSFDWNEPLVGTEARMLDTPTRMDGVYTIQVRRYESMERIGGQKD